MWASTCDASSGARRILGRSLAVEAATLNARREAVEPLKVNSTLSNRPGQHLSFQSVKCEPLISEMKYLKMKFKLFN